MASGRSPARRSLPPELQNAQEAAAEGDMLEIKALSAAKSLHTVATVLTTVQVREAEAAFLRLADKGRPLSFYVDFALTNYREPGGKKARA